MMDLLRCRKPFWSGVSLSKDLRGWRCRFQFADVPGDSEGRLPSGFGCHSYPLQDTMPSQGKMAALRLMGRLRLF